MWLIRSNAVQALSVAIALLLQAAATVAATPEDFSPGHGGERYYWSHRLVGSHVLNMQGQNIGRVTALVVNESGSLTRMLVVLNEKFDVDGTPVPVAPDRAEIVSAKDSQVMVIRINLSKDELVWSQLSQLKSHAKPTYREPAKRDAGAPVTQ